MAHQILWAEGVWVGKEACMHGPEGTLFLRATGGFGSLESLVLDSFLWKVKNDILEFAGIYIVVLDLLQRLTYGSTAEGALVIGEFDESERGVLLPFKGGLINVQRRVSMRLGSLSITLQQ